MKNKVIHVSEDQFQKIKKVMEAKAEIHNKIKQGKFSEIKTVVKFVKPVCS